MTVSQAQLLTFSLLVVLTIVVIAYDVFILRTVGPAATISGVLSRLLELPSAFVVFVFWLGVFVGHVWLPAR
jgi:hypothetical protein